MDGSAPPDNDARRRAVTDTDHSFLVEAGAGSGKTSIIAGRVAALLAHGVGAKCIAAITFTEFAASELRIRIEKFVTELAAGTIPSDLKSALPAGISAEQRENLSRSKKVLDQLLCTTIHGFAQALIKPYPAEAGIDPGAEIIDPAEGDLAFDERYQAWLRQLLSGDREDNVVAELVLADEKEGLALIRSVAVFLRHNRDARPAEYAWSAEAGAKFLAAVAAFEKEIERFEFQEDKTDAAFQAFGLMAKALGPAVNWDQLPSSRNLIEALLIPRDEACFTKDGKRKKLQAKGAWEAAAASAGKRKADGTMAFHACLKRYDTCHEAHEALMAMVASELLRAIADEMEGLLQDWRDYKRSAALLDFDDLLYTAKELLFRHENVRHELAGRFRHVLVDEFQDTDPLQIEILWRLCADPPGNDDPLPLARKLRDGALFLVGDPKQAIYRFRGADVNAYIGAREAMGGASLLKIVANFRSVRPIVSFVNNRFALPLSAEKGQPGFTALEATIEREGDAVAVATLHIAADGDNPDAKMLREAEAGRVAELCARLVGNLQVRDRNTRRPCRFGDIALLAPVGTELWRFEEALEQRGIPVSTQAGKGFFRRQEIQDLIAVARAIADARDTLALGALLRGPLVGLTEAELLDIAEGIPANPKHPDRLQHLTLWTELDDINHELTRRVLQVLQSLARRAGTTTPYMLLSDAISLLDVRAQLRQRFRASGDRALANIDLFLEMARAYDVRGMRAFARDMRANWEEEVRQVEGRPNAEEQSVSLITIHVSKGLEWPVVIPVNMSGTPVSKSGLVHDRRSGGFSIPILDVDPAGYGAIKSWNEEERDREHVRLWYVAATRARDLLVLPKHAAKLSDSSWSRIVDLDIDALPPINPEDFGPERSPPDSPPENDQTGAVFELEARRIADAATTIQWHRPSLHEAGETPSEPMPVFSAAEDAEAAAVVVEIAGSATRGTILHKLMEEVLTGETADTSGEMERRADELLAQLGLVPSTDPKIGIAPKELAETVVRTLSLPEINALRHLLKPEHTVFGGVADGRSETLSSGVADAVALDPSGKIRVVIDWKSDVAITTDRLDAYRAQLGDYRRQTGAERALLVLMTTGQIFDVG